jgi:LCP family protein required for cell wall assembly
MGIDRRPDEPFISRTDTMMVISLDRANQTLSILSLPRDLYVDIPGFTQNRINTAFAYGSRGLDPEAGAETAMATVEHNLGIAIDHYILVDFSAAVRAVDSVGGIHIVVPEMIDDPLYPGMDYTFDPLFIPAGPQHFNGELALKYARTRHGGDDFQRAQRQQAVLLALRDRMLELDLGELLDRAPRLYQQLRQGIFTDLSLSDMVTMAQVLRDIPRANIQTEVLDTRYVVGHTTADGASVLLLRPQSAATLIEALFGHG